MARAPRAKAKKPARRPSPARGGRNASFAALAADALKRGEPDAVPDELLHQTLAAAVKVYAAKAERRGGALAPFGEGEVTATESVVAACALIRAADLNMFDVAMWFHRAPGDDMAGNGTKDVAVAPLSEFADGDYRVFSIDGVEVGVFRLGDKVLAYENVCPHAGGPVCQGQIFHKVEETLTPDKRSAGLRFSEARHLVCPWHGFEFDLETGCHPGDANVRLTPVKVAVRGGQIYVGVAE